MGFFDSIFRKNKEPKKQKEVCIPDHAKTLAPMNEISVNPETKEVVEKEIFADSYPRFKVEGIYSVKGRQDVLAGSAVQGTIRKGAKAEFNGHEITVSDVTLSNKSSDIIEENQKGALTISSQKRVYFRKGDIIEFK
jgi:translation elongation factor EF-Tu-like GTPase